MNGTSTAPLRPRLYGDMLTISETAELCHVAPVTVRRWCDSARLRSYKVGGSRRVFRVDLLAFIDAGEAVKVDPGDIINLEVAE